MFKYYQKFLVILFFFHSIAAIAMQNAKNLSLLQAITQENIKEIQQLCSDGASLVDIDNDGNTIFHILANENDDTLCLVKETPENIITTIIKYTYFLNKESIKQSIKTALLVFNRINNDQLSNNPQSTFLAIPHEIQLDILAKTLSIHTFHKGLYKHLLAIGDRYQQLPLTLTNNHVGYIKQILRTKNNAGKTALELLPKSTLRIHKKTEIELLLEGIKLQNDLDILNNAYPDIASVSENNLALQIFNNHYNPIFTPSISEGFHKKRKNNG